MSIAIGRRTLRAALSVLRPRTAGIPAADAEASASDPAVAVAQDVVRPEAALSRSPEPPLDLCDTAAVENAARLPRDVLLWPPQRAGEINDGIGAARFLIDLLRFCPDLRLRFPRALTGGPHGAFANWLAGDGRDPLGLTDAALDHLRAALGNYSGAQLHCGGRTIRGHLRRTLAARVAL